MPVRVLGICLMIFFSLALVSGCDQQQPQAPQQESSWKSPWGNPQQPYPPQKQPQAGDIFHLPTGTEVTKDQFLQAATDSRVVFMGETHDNLASHQWQTRLLKHMARRYPGRLALGMEMFHKGQQQLLKQWVNGELSEEAFLEQAKWQQNWGIDFGYYRTLMKAARAYNVPIIALNLPRQELMEKAHEQASTSETEKASAPQDPYYQKTVEAYFAGHDHGSGSADIFKQVQQLWDNHMAQRIAAYLQDHPRHHMLVVAGNQHVRHGFGIPRRLYQQQPVSYTLVGTEETEIPPEKQDELMDVNLPKVPLLPYHYALYTKYKSLPGDKPRLGIKMAPAEQGPGIRIVKVIPETPAANQGLEAGDILLQWGQAQISGPQVLQQQVSSQPGDQAVTITLRRDGQQQKLQLTLAPR